MLWTGSQPHGALWWLTTFCSATSHLKQDTYPMHLFSWESQPLLNKTAQHTTNSCWPHIERQCILLKPPSSLHQAEICWQKGIGTTQVWTAQGTQWAAKEVYHPFFYFGICNQVIQTRLNIFKNFIYYQIQISLNTIKMIEQPFSQNKTGYFRAGLTVKYKQDWAMQDKYKFIWMLQTWTSCQGAS